MLAALQRHMSSRVIVAYLLAVLLIVGIGILAVGRLGQISTTVDDLTHNLAVERALADDIVSQVLLVRFYANKYVRTRIQADLDRFNASFNQLEALLQQADRQITDPERADLLNQIKPAVAEYGDTFKRVAELIVERRSIQSEVLSVAELTIDNELTALRMHVISLNDPVLFLAFGNAQNAFQQMRLNATRYLETGDERFVVLFNRGYQQAESAFDRLEALLEDPTQRSNVAEAKMAAGAYRDGFDTIREGQIELKRLFSTRLDVLEPEISNTASGIAASVEREFKTRDAFTQSFIVQTRAVLLTTTGIATLAALGLGLVISRYLRAQTESEQALQEAHDRLEHRVRERTAELRAANKKLQDEVAERKRAEREIEKRWVYLKAVLDAAPDAIVTLDAQQRIAEWNVGAERLFGYSREEAVGRKLDHLITDPNTVHEAARLTETTLSQGQLQPMETVRCRKDGSLIDVIVAASEVRAADQTIGLVAVYTDITERKLAEEQLERYAAELKQANEEVKHFAYIVSHDLRAPLVNLKGFSTELRFALEDVRSILDGVLHHLDEGQRQTLTHALEEDVPEALGFIESSVSRMDHFISAVLKLSRLGRRELELEQVDMEEIVDATLETLAHQIEEQQVQVAVDDLPEVVADRTSMEQIVGNILSNAIKYLDPSRPGEIKISAERNGDEAVFHFRDNGRGIAQDDMDKVFAPFRQAGRQDVPGEGMGLVFVQTLVRRHGGRIWCESELDKGTVFHVTLPVDAKPEV